MTEKVFEFRNIFLDVKNEDKKVEKEYVRLLDGISGRFVSGELNAVMGASGAGKSTLFDVLLGRIENSARSYGTILYDGKERNDSDWIHQVSYLKQDDIYYTKFSILESVLYNLDFYQPFLSKKAKMDLAEEIMKRSNIYNKRHAYIESLSGGERKRAMIAHSMCGDPEIIFMDEPTSGLDSHSALTLIGFMKEYAREKNKIVVISLHQPGEALFNLFDNILYLGKGGVFYDGKINDIPKWLEDNGMAKPEGISVAEYLFELHTENPHIPNIKNYQANVDEIIALNRKKYDHIRRDSILQRGISHLYTGTSLSFMDIMTLTRRYYLNLYRTKGILFSMFWFVSILFVVSFLTHCFFQLILVGSFAYSSSGDNSITDIVDHANSYFTPELKRHASYIIYLVYSFVELICPLFIYNYFNNLVQTTEDVYSGKYTIVSFFIGYLLHDMVITAFWYSLSYGIIFFSLFRPLINYWYFIYVVSVLLCYVVNYIFLRGLFGVASDNSKLPSCILFGVSLTSFFGKMNFPRNALKVLFPEAIEYIKYIFLLFGIFPQFMLKAIYNYLDIDAIQNNTEYLEGNETYIPRVDFMYKDLKPNSVFSYICLEDVSLRTFVVFFVVSLLMNIVFGFLFTRNKIRAYIRLKLNH